MSAAVLAPEKPRVRRVAIDQRPDGHVLDPRTLGDHFDRLFRAAWALCGSREDAEDLVQEAYLRVLSRPRRVRNEDDVGYLLSVVRNTFLDKRRGEARRPVMTEAEPELLEIADRGGGVAGPSSAVEAREVFAAIAALPGTSRETLVAVDVAGLSYGEAAEALNVPEATITTRLFRARGRVARATAAP